VLALLADRRGRGLRGRLDRLRRRRAAGEEQRKEQRAVPAVVPGGRH
jgi:hypothetical protein